MAGEYVPQTNTFVAEENPKMTGRIEKILEKLKEEIKAQFPDAEDIEARYNPIYKLFIARFLTQNICSMDVRWMQKMARRYGLEQPNFDAYPHKGDRIEVYLSWFEEEI